MLQYSSFVSETADLKITWVTSHAVARKYTHVVFTAITPGLKKEFSQSSIKDKINYNNHLFQHNWHLQTCLYLPST